MRYIAALLILLSFTFVGCKPKPMKSKKGKPSRPERIEVQTPESEAITRIVITYARELEDTHNLFLYNSHVVFDDTIKKIRIDFTSQMSVELCEARKILVDIVEGYLKMLQGNNILRDSFEDKPVGPEILEIHVTFTSYFNKHVDFTYTSYIILEDGMAFFYNSELNAPFTDIWMKKIEPYEKTKQIVTFREEAELYYEKEHEEKPRALEEERLYIKTNRAGSVITR